MTSESNEANGMVLSLLGGLDSASDFRCLDLKKDLYHIGLSHYDDFGARRFHDLRIRHTPYNATFEEDIPTLKFFNPIWLSIDAGALDINEFSSSLNRQNGITVNYLHKLIKHLKPQLIGADITEVNFDLAPSSNREKDVDTIVDLV